MTVLATRDATGARLATLLEMRTAANSEFFAREAERLARLCHRMAERFARGGELIALGSSPAARSDARHVAVEFVHPVIVGKRALPAIALTGAQGGAQLKLIAREQDIVMVFLERDEDSVEMAFAVAQARARGCLTVAFARLGAEWEFDPPSEHPHVRQELVETLYHVLWELVHVFFEHRGLLAGREGRRVHDAGASSFLYPFLSEQESELEPVVENVSRSALMKAAETGALRAQTLTDNRDALLGAARELRACFERGGKLLALGNGGSATDAMDAVADFAAPAAGGPARPAIDLSEDSGILTAIANDIGVEAIFSRQVIAYGRRGDALLALSTSGNSANVIEGLGEARRRGLLTIAMVGYDGGRVGSEGLADHVVVTRSEHIPRIQEAQASAYHALPRSSSWRRERDRERTQEAAVSAQAPVAGAPATMRRTRVRVEGTVQGVGFRPYVYRLARELALAGFVLNDSHGVLLEVEGDAGAVERFLSLLGPSAPPLAVVERVLAEEREPCGERGFAIRESARSGTVEAPVTPDSATCEDCLRELFDAADRRYRYPFINCTNCGPRFTIVRSIPYDRPLTTMAGFAMCEQCRAEYEDPGDRRFHAQPNACARCGPSASLLHAAGGRVAAEPPGDAVRAAAEALFDGRIVAVKGVGGYHLACRADDEAAVALLRARKHREDKPFALMLASVEAAGALVTLGPGERALLSAPERPIVLATRVAEAPVAPSVAPGAPALGVMLAYSPLHHLLLADLEQREVGSVVMTSGNVSDEPIAYRDEDALARLGAIADLLLVHDRPIQTRTDDSVARVVEGPAGARAMLLRRSRGYVPASLPLAPAAERPILACGAELKNTFCLAKGSRAWLSHHIGDLENYETLRSFGEGIGHLERLLGVRPEVLAHDLHPEYLSTKYATDCDPERLIGVQHHHAHLAACLAEHRQPGSAVGAIFDGTGYGPDGSVWGGELLVGDLEDYRRVGALMAVRLPGGVRAIREPWRMACAWLSAAAEGADAEPPLPSALRGSVPEQAWRQVAKLAQTGVQSPLTTSIGRLFDAVAALSGVRARVNYEGQAAIELEAACDPGERGAYHVSLRREGELIVIDPREAIRAVSADAARGTPLGAIASRFHAGLASATVQALVRAASREHRELVVLSGGVFANRRLLESVLAGLHAAGLNAIVPERVPVGDGGISYGQAAVAARRLAVAAGS